MMSCPEIKPGGLRQEWIHQNPNPAKDMLAAHFVCMINDLVNSEDDPGHLERMRGVRETTVCDLNTTP